MLTFGISILPNEPVFSKWPIHNAVKWCMGKDPFKVQEKPIEPNVKQF